VRIQRIQVEGFGRLCDFDTGLAELEPLVVVWGPNEAGKSTLFEFLTTALYGFQPATRERNPHGPWGADEAAGRIRVRLDGGGCAEVERRLRSVPSGRLTLDGAPVELRNQPVPWVEHVPRTVFRQVFAITLGELAGLDAETWSRIQDKVVGSMGSSDLRSARAVADDLEREAGEIWRPSRRGNQRLRELQARIRDLRARSAEARERDVRIRALTEESERTRAELARAREQRQRDRLALEHAQALAPIERQRSRVAQLRAEGGDRNILRGLPADPPARFAALEAERARLEARDAALAVELAEREAEAAALDDGARRLLARRDEVLRTAARAAALRAERARAADLEAEVGRLADEEGALRARSRSTEPTEKDRTAPGIGALQRAGPRRGLELAALATGAVVLLVGLLEARAWLASLGAGLAGLGLAGWLAYRRPPSEAVAKDRGPSGHDLERLQALAHLRGVREAALETARARVAEAESEIRGLAAALGMAGDTVAEPEALAETLDRALRRAERAEEAGTAAEREARRIRRERERIASELAALQPELSSLRAAGERLGDGDPVAGLERARARLEAHERADRIEEMLERLAPESSLDVGLRPHVAGATGELETLPDGPMQPYSGGLETVTQEQLVLLRTRVESAEAEVERLVERSEALAGELARLRELETADAVDSEIASLKEAEAALVRERDRKWVLAKLLREADRRFREEHQPDLLRRAGSYLAHLTGGRYHRLVAEEAPDEHLFHVVGPALPGPIPLASPVSTGTLEQAYLGLRLAIVDHLDRSGERLPLFVDEVFVNWDGARRTRGLEVLVEMSEVRQVFVFTCHPGVAEELAARGAHTIELEAAEGSAVARGPSRSRGR
jgi:DNA repair exonuclease SbcCD ATPase subunit